MTLNIPELEKIKPDYAPLMALLESQEKKNKVKVTIPPKKRGSGDTTKPVLEFHIVKEIPSAALAAYVEMLKQVSIQQDDRGVYWLNPTNLQMGTHAFILENFSTLPLPIAENGEPGEIDSSFVTNVGDYLLKNVPKYAELYHYLQGEVLDDVKRYIDSLNNAVAVILSNAIDVRDLIADSDIKNAIIGNLAAKDNG